MPSRRSARVSRIRILASLAALAIAALVGAPGSVAAADSNGWSIEILSSAPDQVSGGDALVRVEFPGDADQEERAPAPERRGRDGLARPRRRRPGGRGRRASPSARTCSSSGRAPNAQLGEGAARGRQPSDRRADLLRPAAAALRLHHGARRPRAADHRQPGPTSASRSRRRTPAATTRATGAAIRRPPPPSSARARTARATGASSTSTAPPPAPSRRSPIPPRPLPADIAMTTTLDGQTVPYIVRWERGTINRFIYSVAMLAPTTETDPEPARRLAVERAAGLQPRGRRRDRAHAGHDRRRRHAARRRAAARLRGAGLERPAHQHALQPPARRRDGADAEGALHRGPRRPALHRGRRRLRRRDPAVRLRAEPSGADRRGDPAVLLLRHDHADDPRRRLRAARALLRQDGPLQHEVGRTS